MEDNTREATTISVSAETMDRLIKLAQEDFRNRSTEVAFLVNQEWDRRKLLKVPTTPSAARKPERN